MPLHITESELAKLQRGSAPQERERKAKASVIREPATGLSTLLRDGWNVEWDATMRIRLWRGALDTGFHATERAACDAAKRMR